MCQKISGSQTAADSYTITDVRENDKRFFDCHFQLSRQILAEILAVSALLSLLNIKYEIAKVLLFFLDGHLYQHNPTSMNNMQLIFIMHKIKRQQIFTKISKITVCARRPFRHT